MSGQNMGRKCERYPHFRGVLIEQFHCITRYTCIPALPNYCQVFIHTHACIHIKYFHRKGNPSCLWLSFTCTQSYNYMRSMDTCTQCTCLAGWLSTNSDYCYQVHTGPRDAGKRAETKEGIVHTLVRV